MKRLSLLYAICFISTIWGETGHAELRYLLSTDLREEYNSNVFAGSSTGSSWDLVTEVEPGIRLTYRTPRDLLWLSYRFLFQLYARTEDPTAARRLLGYANTLRLEYSHLLSRRTGLRATNRFHQGTENTLIEGMGDSAGTVQPAFFTTGSKFVGDDALLELQHLFNERWSILPAIHAGVYRAYDRAEQTVIIAPPNNFEAGATATARYSMPRDDLEGSTSFTLLREEREGLFPSPLATYFAETSLGWRHHFSESWRCFLSAGVEYHSRELFSEGSTATAFYGGWGPVGTAALEYRRGRTISVSLDYFHRYQAMLAFDSATTANTDQVALAAEWFLSRWSFEVGGLFRYLHASTRLIDAQDVAATKVGQAEASVGYQLVAGVSLELGYQLEVVRDRATLTLPGAPPQLPRDYERHLVVLGLSLAWPPPPPQETRLNRRESDYEPILETEEGSAPTRRPDADRAPAETDPMTGEPAPDGETADENR